MLKTIDEDVRVASHGESNFVPASMASLSICIGSDSLTSVSHRRQEEGNTCSRLNG